MGAWPDPESVARGLPWSPLAVSPCGPPEIAVSGLCRRGCTGFTKLILTVEPIPSATVMGAKIGPIPPSKALDKTPGRFRAGDFEF